MSLKHSINSLKKDELIEYMLTIGENKYRAKQIWHWMYVKGVKSFSEMTDIGKDLRAKLSNTIALQRLNTDLHKISSDGTQKWVLQLYDKNKIETVFIPEETRGTLCISSQVGCTLNCSFCYTGTMPLVRNLTADEIIGQLLLVKDLLNDWSKYKNKRKITNIVFMGMGEPLYNYDEVLKSINILTDKEGLGYSKRKITLSTSGVVPVIEKLKDEIEIGLAISLHAVRNELRDSLVPINRKWSIEKLIEVLTDYPKTNNSRRITFEYVMLEGINDSIEDAKILRALLKPLYAKVNLIPFNPWPGSNYKSSSLETINRFADTICNDKGIMATVRQPRGQDIFAACGQLKSISVRKNNIKNVN